MFLSDVEDSSFVNCKPIIDDLAEKFKIYCTVVGISDSFRSDLCENLTEIRGFNYLCAVEDTDLIKYLVDQFDYTFFPFLEDLYIYLESP